MVLGGRVIGVGFASLWRSFGAEVTIIEALPRLGLTEDEDLPKLWIALLRGPRSAEVFYSDRLT